MIRSSRHIRINSFVLVLMLFPFIVNAQIQSEFESAPIHDIMHFLEKSNQDVATLTQTKKLLTVQYDSLVFDIDRIKQAGDVGFFDRFELKGLLKESEDIAKQIVKIDNLIKSHENANRRQVTKLVEMMDQEIMDTLGILLRRKPGSSIEMSAGMSKLDKMFADKEPYPVYRMKKFVMPVIDLKTQRTDDAEVLYQKADYILDHLDRLSGYCDDLDRMMDFLSFENNLKNRVRSLIDLLEEEDTARSWFLSYFPDSVVALQRLPLSKYLVTPFDTYDTLIERLIVEKEAALSRMRLFREKSDDIREIADYKTKVWAK